MLLDITLRRSVGMMTRVPFPVRVRATISVWFSGVEQTGAP
jgi:hypothetical protein